MHSSDAVKHIGRQYGIEGEYMDLANCPTCGSTICVGPASRPPPAKRPSTRASARAHR